MKPVTYNFKRKRNTGLLILQKFLIIPANVKGPCHERVAVLGQFCAQVITQCLYNTQNALLGIWNISNKFYQGALIIIIFVSMALKLEKVGQTFSSFNECSFLPSVKTDDRKKIQCRNIVFNNKTILSFSESN